MKKKCVCWVVVVISFLSQSLRVSANQLIAIFHGKCNKFRDIYWLPIGSHNRFVWLMVFWSLLRFHCDEFSLLSNWNDIYWLCVWRVQSQFVEHIRIHILKKQKKELRWTQDTKAAMDKNKTKFESFFFFSSFQLSTLEYHTYIYFMCFCDSKINSIVFIVRITKSIYLVENNWKEKLSTIQLIWLLTMTMLMMVRVFMFVLISEGKLEWRAVQIIMFDVIAWQCSRAFFKPIMCCRNFIQQTNK